MNTESKQTTSAQAGASSSTDATRPPDSDASLSTLFKTLATDISTLVSKEMALARAEMREAAAGVKTGVAGIAMGGAMTLAGLIVLLFAAVYGIANWLPLWTSALIVGIVVCVIGIVMTRAGQSKIEPQAFVPQRTAGAMQQDKELAERKVS